MGAPSSSGQRGRLAPSHARLSERAARRVPACREQKGFGEPEEVAAAAAFLVSDDTSFITASTSSSTASTVPT